MWTVSYTDYRDYAHVIDMSKTQRSHIKITHYFIATLEIYDGVYVEINALDSYFSLLLDVMLFLRSFEY